MLENSNYIGIELSHDCNICLHCSDCAHRTIMCELNAVKNVHANVDMIISLLE